MPHSDESTLETQLTEHAATTAFQLVWGLIEKFRRNLWDKHLVQAAAKQYAASYQNRHGLVKVLGMSQPIPLHQIFTNVRVVDPSYLHKFTDPDELEDEFKTKPRKQNTMSRQKDRDAIDVANDYQFLNLLGAPGSGKSTFLRRLGHEALRLRVYEQALGNDFDCSRYTHNRLPVLIELKDFRTGDIDLVARIAHEFEVCGFPKSRAFVESALEAGGLLVLLDGLDEVPDDHLDYVVDHVVDIIDQYGEGGGNRFVTSCRTAHYANHFTQFTDVVLTDFNDEQIQKFASNWFQNDQNAGLQFFKMLQQTENAGALELARTPLLLTFLCLTFSYGQELPPTKATLYRRSLDILLREWNSEKRVHKEAAYEELTAELELDLLADLAADLFQEERFFFQRQVALDAIQKFMAAELKAPRSLNSEEILSAIEIHQGLIVRRAQDSYSFSHLTIQEYLVAKKLWEEDGTEWRKAIGEHLSENRWAVVFELMAGISKSDRVLLALAYEARKLLERIPNIEALCGPLNLERRNRDDQMDAAGRLLCLTVALALGHDSVTCSTFALALARGFARDVDVDVDVDTNIDSSCVVDIARDIARDIDIDIDITFAVARDIDIDIIDRVLNDLARVLSSYQLILRCKRAAYRVSQHAWHTVCRTILNIDYELTSGSPSVN